MTKLLTVTTTHKFPLQGAKHQFALRLETVVPRGTVTVGNLLAGLKTASSILKNSDVGTPVQLLFVTNGNREDVSHEQVVYLVVLTCQSKGLRKKIRI